MGYDEVCCLAAEAKNPKKNLPLAVVGTVAIVTILYVLSSLSLVGMLPYSNDLAANGFTQGFAVNNNTIAQQIVSIGELITLPVVTLISFLAQPRLQFAMAEDGLLPQIFSQLDSRGNLLNSIVITGIICTLIALFVPFTNLNDMISAGIMISFSMTNSSLILIRKSKVHRPLTNNLPLRSFFYVNINHFHQLLGYYSCEMLLVFYHVFSLIFSFTLTYLDLSSYQVIKFNAYT